MSVIGTTRHAEFGPPIPTAHAPAGISVHPDGSRVYVTQASNALAIIEVRTHQVLETLIPVAGAPIALGHFIGPAPPSP